MQSIRAFKAAETVVKRATHRLELPKDRKTFGFGRLFVPHMLTCEWTAKGGWGKPQIGPFQNLSLPPGASSLHYAISCFEGMKAYKDAAGQVRLFRPDANARRFHSSCERIALPSIPEFEFVEAVRRVVAQDAEYVPTERGYSLYIRPTMFATDPVLGVKAPDSAMFMIISAVSGSYYANGFAPVTLYIDPKNRRAWHGGAAAYKIAANYAPTIVPATAALRRTPKCDQVLWLGDKGNVTEVGSMNIMVSFRRRDGTVEVVTPPLDDTILPGVTRDSALKLLRDGAFPGVIALERDITVTELAAAAADGRLLEVFGTGTAAIVSQVKEIQRDDGPTIVVPTPPNSLAERLMDKILSIQHGEVPHEWSVKV